jgi:hypothetical protein
LKQVNPYDYPSLKQIHGSVYCSLKQILCYHYPSLARDFPPISKTKYIQRKYKNLFDQVGLLNMEDETRRSGKDEMNLAVLPIAKLGRADRRDLIEYYGTFTVDRKQQEMVWTVRGAAGLGLPGELGERVLVALFYIGAQDGFKTRRLEFSTYQILRILGLSDGSGNYRGVERAIAQLHGITVTSDLAWIQKEDDGKMRRARVSKGFHLIEDYTLWNLEDSKEKKSHIIWGKHIWQNIKAGYIKPLDIDFYYDLKNPLSRRLYRFLDKMTNYRPAKPYVIDIFALANKLGMVPNEYPSYIKRLLKKAADELVERGWLTSYEFVKSGNFHRVRFYRTERSEPVPLSMTDSLVSNLGSEEDNDPLADLWATIVERLPDDSVPQKLAGTQLLSIEEGTATIAGGAFRDWLENRLGHRILKALQREMAEIAAVRFVE